MIIILDFGSQTTHLIGRRLRDLGIEIKILDSGISIKEIKKIKPAGIILSGGPSSVYEKGAPKVSSQIFTLGIPILGICYGWQLMAKLLGGEVAMGKKEYGPAYLKIEKFKDLFYGLPETSRVFESHGDTVIKAPKNFRILAKTEAVPLAALGHKSKPFFGVQFHPEVEHTQFGKRILQNFATKICNLALKPKRLNTREMIKEIKEEVGSKKVIGAVSGGTDSAVAAVLAVRAIDKQFIPVYIDSGLMREGTLGRIKKEFPQILGMPVRVVRARREFLKRLKGVKNPERKRKVIGRLYIELFEKEMKKHKNVSFLLQGTTYADFIHSKGSKRSALIKSHHNVGGLPKKMNLKLIEPLRYFYTDQVRQIGVRLGLPKNIVYQQPFPGPGHAVRIVGKVTAKRLKQQIQADAIVVEELKKQGWYKKIFQCWSIMTGTNSTAIKGDSRFFGEVVAIRVVTTKERMTVDWAKLPHKVMARLSARIVNEVPDISRVVYDITTKPPATMEWE